MEIEETALPGVLKVCPQRAVDARGSFHESLRVDRLAHALGAEFVPKQVNFSTSCQNTLRGLHGVVSPPGQAKYVTCVRGALRDIVVDLRVGSPTFGQHVVTVLDPESGTALYVPEGMGHGFLSLTGDATICYMVSTIYVPGTQFEVDALDAELQLPWEFDSPPLRSAKDANALTVQQALDRGVLSRWEGSAAR